jgi:hypothetical protein
MAAVTSGPQQCRPSRAATIQEDVDARIAAGSASRNTLGRSSVTPEVVSGTPPLQRRRSIEHNAAVQ